MDLTELRRLAEAAVNAQNKMDAAPQGSVSYATADDADADAISDYLTAACDAVPELIARVEFAEAEADRLLKVLVVAAGLWEELVEFLTDEPHGDFDKWFEARGKAGLAALKAMEQEP